MLSSVQNVQFEMGIEFSMLSPNCPYKNTLAVGAPYVYHNSDTTTNIARHKENAWQHSTI